MKTQRFIAKIETHGFIKKWNIPSILLLDVKDEEGNLVRDHTWVKYSKRFKDFKLGDTVEFTARVEYYEKGNKTRKGLRHLRNLELVA